MNLKSMFFKEVDVKETPTKQSAQTSARTPVPTNNILGQEDNAIREQLLASLEKANIQGYDYFEFAKAVDAQAALIPSEATRFQASFAAAATMNVTIDTLLSSANHYLGVLSKNEQEFLSALDEHSNKAITGKEEEIKQLDANMQKMVEQIKVLNEEINKLQESRTTLTNEVSTNKAEAEKVKTNFYTTLNVIVEKIKSDVDKINTYIKPVK
jgi:chromosome segregation ATPase